jgi:nicotinamide riboside transporter PnuC
MDLWIELTGWLGMILIILGRFGIARKKRIGFTIVCTGSVFAGGQAYLMNNWSILLLCVFLCAIDLHGWFHWRKTDDEIYLPSTWSRTTGDSNGL